MQEQLGVLFCMVAGLNDSMGMAIWHALKSDRSQRDLLEAATEAAAEDKEWTSDFPKGKEDINWILKKVNNLTDGRNSAIHAPVLTIVGDVPEIRPLTLYGNPNAERLRGKDIFAEFEWYEKYFDTLQLFAAEISLALIGRGRPNSAWMTWPDRPLLPTVQQKRDPQGHNHQDDPK